MSKPTHAARKPSKTESTLLEKRDGELADIRNWEDIADSLPDLPDTLRQYRAAQLAKSAAEKEMDELKPVLHAALMIGGRKSIACGSLKITEVFQERKSLSAERLIEKGVSMEIMQWATITKVISYPVVTEIKSDPTEP